MEGPSLMGVDLGDHNTSDGIHVGARGKIFRPDVLEALESWYKFDGD